MGSLRSLHEKDVSKKYLLTQLLEWRGRIKGWKKEWTSFLKTVPKEHDPVMENEEVSYALDGVHDELKQLERDVKDFVEEFEGGKYFDR